MWGTSPGKDDPPARTARSAAPPGKARRTTSAQTSKRSTRPTGHRNVGQIIFKAYYFSAIIPAFGFMTQEAWSSERADFTELVRSPGI